MITLMHLLSLAGVECLAFLLSTLSVRYCAAGRVVPTLFTDLLISLNGFVLIRLVADSSTPQEAIAYMVGAGVGSVAGMWLTREESSS